jgi:hypothetical protein
MDGVLGCVVIPIRDTIKLGDDHVREAVLSRISILVNGLRKERQTTYLESFNGTVRCRSEWYDVFCLGARSNAAVLQCLQRGHYLLGVSICANWLISYGERGNTHLVDFLTIDFWLEFKLDDVNNSHCEGEGCVSLWWKMWVKVGSRVKEDWYVCGDRTMVCLWLLREISEVYNLWLTEGGFSDFHLRNIRHINKLKISFLEMPGTANWSSEAWWAWWAACHESWRVYRRWAEIGYTTCWQSGRLFRRDEYAPSRLSRVHKL